MTRSRKAHGLSELTHLLSFWQKGASSGRSALTKKAAKVTEQYWSDYDQYNLNHGSHPVIAHGRERLEAIPGAYKLLRQLLDFDPTHRVTMLQALESPVFEGLIEADTEATGQVISFMTYYGRPLRVV